jgi:uncharacterized delta-60 repeat protein
VWAVPTLGPLAERRNLADTLGMLIHHDIRRLATNLALAVLALLALACTWTQVARADTAGALDASFSADGRVTTDLFGGGSDYAQAVAVQPDGKIVAVGRWRFGTTAANFALARYNPDGTLDDEFGSGGRVMTDFDAEGRRSRSKPTAGSSSPGRSGSAGAHPTSASPATTRTASSTGRSRVTASCGRTSAARNRRRRS